VRDSPNRAIPLSLIVVRGDATGEDSTGSYAAPKAVFNAQRLLYEMVGEVMRNCERVPDTLDSIQLIVVWVI
jgi:hypothetical protein